MWDRNRAKGSRKIEEVEDKLACTLNWPQKKILEADTDMKLHSDSLLLPIVFLTPCINRELRSTRTKGSPWSLKEANVG